MPRRNTNHGDVVRHSGSDDCNLNKVFRHSLTEATTEQRPSRKAGGMVSLGVGKWGAFQTIGTASVMLLRLGPATHVLAQQGREASSGDKVREVSLVSHAFTPQS